MASDKDLIEENAAEEQVVEPYTGETPGQLFREAREAKGLSTQQVADSLRLRKTVIEQMEADEFEQFSSPTFVRGYLRSIAKALEVDEKRVFEAYSNMGYGAVAASTITMQSFSKRKVRERNDSRLMLISYLIIAVVIAMAVVWWWQDSNAGKLFENGAAVEQSESRTSVRRGTNNPVATGTTDDSAAETAAETVTQTTEEPLGEPVAQPDEVVSEQSPAKPTAQITTEPVEAAMSNEPDGADESASVEQPVSEETTASNIEPTTASAALVFEFSGDCWVKVTDGTGTDIAIGVKNAGYTMPLTGQPPFDIILCKPEFVAITFNGEPVDLSNYRRNRSVSLTLSE